jgi:hypothetical protein
MENWINAKILGGGDVKVRQEEPFSRMFIGDDEIVYDVSGLNFTGVPSCNADILKQLDENNKRYAEQQVEHQELMNKMLASMDANAIADHKAEIDEREYWRKLRGDIAIEVLRKSSDINHLDIMKITQQLFNILYEQDKEFFK